MMAFITGIFTIFGGITSFQKLMSMLVSAWQLDQEGRLQAAVDQSIKADANVVTSEDVKKAAHAEAEVIRKL